MGRTPQKETVFRLKGDNRTKGQKAADRLHSKMMMGNPYGKSKRATVKCPHCSKVGAGGAMKQWHFDNCKQAKL